MAGPKLGETATGGYALKEDEHQLSRGRGEFTQLGTIALGRRMVAGGGGSTDLWRQKEERHSRKMRDTLVSSRRERAVFRGVGAGGGRRGAHRGRVGVAED